MEAICAIAKKHRLAVIEDCAQAHGAEVNGKKAGSLGDVSCFSFYGNKILTTGEGGMVLCRNEKLAARMRTLRDQGFQEPRFVHEVMGFNYRLTNVQAAIGLAQVERVDEKILAKRRIGQTYNELLAGNPDFTLPYEEPWARNVYWMYGILVEKSFGVAKDDLMKKLKEKGVHTRSFFSSNQPATRISWLKSLLSRRSRKLSSLSGSVEPRSLPSFRSRPDSTANGSGVVEKLLECKA